MAQPTIPTPDRTTQPPVRGGWQHSVVSTIHMEIDSGNLVRVSLPGASRPIVVDDVQYMGDMVCLLDGIGSRYYVGSMDQVVIVACPMPTGPADA